MKKECKECEGTGERRGSVGIYLVIHSCDKCNGKGWIE